MTEQNLTSEISTIESLKTTTILLLEREKNLKEIETELKGKIEKLVAHMSSLRDLPADIQKMITASTKVVGDTLKDPIKNSLKEDVLKLKEEIETLTRLFETTHQKANLFEKNRFRKTLIVALIAFLGCVGSSCLGVWVMFQTTPPIQIIKNVENISVLKPAKYHL